MTVLVETTVPRTASAAGGPRSPRRPTSRRTRAALTAYAFLAPGFALFLLLIIYPMVKAFQMSLYDWNVVAGRDQRLHRPGQLPHRVPRPGLLAGTAEQCLLHGGDGAAADRARPAGGVLLNNKAPGRTLFRVLFYLPVVTSWVVVSLLFQYLFADNGLVNWVLHDITHVTAHDTSWLSGRWTGLVAISALGVWKGVGWSMMIFLAALQGVPQELLESAEVDGAGRWGRFRAVTLPAIWPAVGFVTIMLVIGGFNVFISVLLMTGGGPADSTQVLLTYMYKQAFTNLDFGYGSAIAVLLTLGVFVLSAVQLRAFKVEDES